MPLPGKSLTSIAVASLIMLLGNGVCFALPNYSRTATLTYNNPGGPNANDLHVSTVHSVVNASATGFANAALDSPGIGDVTYTGGSVAPGGTSTATVVTKFASDVIDVDSSYWTRNGAQIGTLTTAANGINPVYTSVGTQIEVALNNTTASAVSYSSLAIYTGANESQWTVENYLNVAASTGTPVTLLVPDSGTLPTGLTDVALFTPSSSLSQFDAGSVLIDGALIGAGDNAAAVPEPATLVMIVLGLGTSLVYCQFHQRRARRGA